MFLFKDCAYLLELFYMWLHKYKMIAFVLLACFSIKASTDERKEELTPTTDMIMFCKCFVWEIF